MNLKELDEIIKRFKIKGDHECVAFYKMKRKELVNKILKKLKENDSI